MRIFINYKQHASPDHEFAREVERTLQDDGHQVFRDETGLVPSEKWPARLEREIRMCDAMVSIVSNAALKSSWVTNEIDLAIELEKRIIPVVMEDIDKSLEFQIFRPRFTGTQWLRASGESTDDCARLVAILRETRHHCYRTLIEAKLAEHGINDGREILEALCGVLYQSHWPAVIRRCITNASLPDIETPPGRSLAEELCKSVREWAAMAKHNADIWRKSGDETQSKLLTWQAQRLACFTGMMDTLLEAWNRNSARRAISVSETQYLFDASDGEDAFASEYADPKLQKKGRVPHGVIAQVHEFRPTASNSNNEALADEEAE